MCVQIPPQKPAFLGCGVAAKDMAVACRFLSTDLWRGVSIERLLLVNHWLHLHLGDGAENPAMVCVQEKEQMGMECVWGGAGLRGSFRSAFGGSPPENSSSSSPSKYLAGRPQRADLSPPGSRAMELLNLRLDCLNWARSLGGTHMGLASRAPAAGTMFCRWSTSMDSSMSRHHERRVVGAASPLARPPCHPSRGLKSAPLDKVVTFSPW